MILLTILLVTVIVIAVIATPILLGFGVAFIVAFGDVIIFALIARAVIKHIIKKRKGL